MHEGCGDKWFSDKIMSGLTWGPCILKFRRKLLFSIKSNILLKDNKIKIADFGISRIINNNDTSLSIRGTPDYMSPEMINGSSYKYKTDVW